MLFRDIIGHQAIKKQLIANINNKRISHTQLFLGPEGSGQLPLALAAARYMQCRQRQPEDACGTCPSCLKMQKLEHPDLHFFFPVAANQEHKKDVSSKLFYPHWRDILIHTPYFSYLQWLEKTGIENKQAIINAEDCNDIIRKLGLKTFDSPYKIVIIYMIEKLYHAAAPKLLKILEEPPENTLFMLIAENKEKILHTILSRAQIMKVPALHEEELEAALTDKHGLAEKDAKHIAMLASGSYTEALSLIHNLHEPSFDFEQLRNWMRLCFKNDVQNILIWVDTFSKSGREKQKSFLQYGIKMLRLCMMQNYKVESLIRLGGEEQQFIKGLAPYVNHKNILQVFEAFSQALFHIERNANPRVLFADLSFILVRQLRAFK